MAQLLLLQVTLLVLVAMVAIVALFVQIVKLAIHNVIQTINYYRLYINDIHKADNEVKYTKLNKKITNVTIIT